MKLLRKKISVMVILALTATQNIGFGNGNCNNRNNCDWTVNTPWQYKAHARVSKLLVPKIKNDVDCPYNGGDSYAFAYIDNSCAWQSAANYYGAWTFGGSVFKTPSICSRGFLSSQMYYDALSNQFSQANEEFESSKITSEKFQFGEREISISNINANIFVSGRSLFSSFEIIMWLPDVDYKNGLEDQDITEKKTFWRGKIELYRGEAIVSGNFPKDSYSLVKVKGGYNLIIKNLNIKAALPAGISGTKNLIEVTGISDAGVHDQVELAGLIGETAQNSLIDFQVSPNPTSDILNVYFKSEFQDKISTVTMKLYDKLGNPVASLYEGEIVNGEIKQVFDLNQFLKENGLYYLMIQQLDKTYLKTIIYQN